MKRLSLKKSFSCTLIELIKWILDSRMLILAVLLVFIYNFAVLPLKDNAALMRQPLNMLEPFIAVANSGTILLIIPVVFLTLIADFPKIDTSTAFYISRVGRINWLIGQIMKLVMMDLIYIAIIFLGTCVPMLADGFWSDSWSMVATDFAEQFPDKAGNFGVQLIPDNLYNQMGIYTAAAESYLMVFLYLMIIGLILLTFSVVKRKALGFVMSGVVISLGTALCAVKSKIMWVMPMANSIIWLHYTKYYREPVVSMWISVCYMCTVIGCLLAFCCVSIRNFSYDNVAEVVF